MKKSILFISIIVMLILSSCNTKKFEPNDMIMSPENNISPIKGK